MDSKIKLNDLDSKFNEIKTQMIVDKLENYCLILKSAVVNLRLDFPPLVSFERNLNQLNKIDDIRYVMDMIHDCVAFIYPSYLFERPIKKEITPDDILNSLKGKNNFGHFEDEALRHNYSGARICHHYAFNSMDAKLQQVYKDYFNGLHAICKSLCAKHNIDEPSNLFLISDKVEITGITLDQIDYVFQVVANEGKMINNEETAFAFKSLFSVTNTISEQQIEWLDVAKNGGPNYSTLYLLFKTLRVNMNESNKEKICKAFYSKKGDILPKYLKDRSYNDSKSSKDFEDLIKSALSKTNP